MSIACIITIPLKVEIIIYIYVTIELVGPYKSRDNRYLNMLICISEGCEEMRNVKFMSLLLTKFLLRIKEERVSSYRDKLYTVHKGRYAVNWETLVSLNCSESLLKAISAK